MESLRLPKRTRTTIEKIAGIALEHLPMTFSPTDLGTGRKVFFPIPIKNRPTASSDFIYIYAESKLPYDPEDTEVGFTDTDVIDSTGVYVFKKIKSSTTDRVYGQVFPLDVLLRDIISQLSLRNRIIYRINEMKTMIHLDEEFLELANMERAARRSTDVVRRLH